MKSCSCEDLPSAVDIGKGTFSWPDGFVQLAEKPFLTLRQCRSCGQLWQFDLIDKLQTCLAIKVETVSNWGFFEDKRFRIEHLVRSRGGLSAETCVMQNCPNRALRTLAYCPDHAYEYAGLRE